MLPTPDIDDLIRRIERNISRRGLTEITPRLAREHAPAGIRTREVQKSIDILCNRGRLVWLGGRRLSDGMKCADRYLVVDAPISADEARKELLHYWMGFRPDNADAVDRNAFYLWARLLCPEILTWPIADDADRAAIVIEWLQVPAQAIPDWRGVA